LLVVHCLCYHKHVDTLEGIVERITYYNEENGYTVLRLKPRYGSAPSNALSHDGLTTVVGNLPEVTPGESLKLKGEWAVHRDHGRQFKAESCEQVLPATIEGLKKYLGSGLIKGVGPVTAGRIVRKFGLETLTMLDTDPQRIRRSDPGRPEICPVFDLHKIFTPPARREEAATGCRTAGIGCLDCKDVLLAHLLPALEPIRERRQAFAEKPERIVEVLQEGSRRARAVAAGTMDEVRRAVHLTP